MKSGFGIFVSVFLFCACNSAVKEYSTEPYFNVPAFFDVQAKNLKLRGCKLVKHTQASNKIDSLRLESPDWNQEFKLFRKVNLNLPALSGKYMVTKDKSDSVQSIRYRLPEGTPGIVELKLTENVQRKVHALECHIYETSLLTTHSENWRYVSDSGYKYSGFDRINGITTNSYSISGRIVASH